MADCFSRFDIFADVFNFEVKNRSQRVKTVLGSLISISVLCCVVIYGYLKYVVMKEYEDTSIMSSSREYYYSDNDILTDKMGFNVAFGLTEFDGKSDYIEDPDYGTLVAKYRSWGLSESAGTGVSIVSQRRCTP